MNEDAVVSSIALLLAIGSLIYFKKYLEHELYVKWSRLLGVIVLLFCVGAAGLAGVLCFVPSLFIVGVGVTLLRLGFLAVLFGTLILVVAAQDVKKQSWLSHRFRKVLASESKSG